MVGATADRRFDAAAAAAAAAVDEDETAPEAAAETADEAAWVKPLVLARLPLRSLVTAS